MKFLHGYVAALGTVLKLVQAIHYGQCIIATGQQRSLPSCFSFPLSVLLMMVAFRAEVVIAEYLEKLELNIEWLSNADTTLKRGSTPTVVEWLILGWVVGE